MSSFSNPASGDRPQLDDFHHFPDALLDVPASELWQHLRGPSLFRIPGRRAAPLFVSVLLHGNEDSGWRGIQTVLRQHCNKLHRPLLLFIGNIAAARAKVRTLPDQEDYNRSWPGTLRPETLTAQMLRQVVEIVRRAQPFASIDIHNNTGNNPHYACVNSFDERHLQLARLFGRTVVYFEQPVGVQSAALAKICPAVTVECGRASEEAGVSHVAELIGSTLALAHFPDRPVADGDLDLMRTFAIVKVPPGADFSCDGTEADFRLRGDLDRLNFSELDAGTLFGTLGNGRCLHLDVTLVGGGASKTDYFEYSGGDIRLSQRAIPAMLTLDPSAVRLDCLGYLMHRIRRDGLRITE